MIIRVLQKHIDSGVAYNDEKCALALAIKDHSQSITFVSVSVDMVIVFYKNSSIETFRPTKKIIDFIESYDSGYGSGVKDGLFRLMRTHQRNLCLLQRRPTML